MTISLTNGDCLKLMKNLPDKSVDLFICDLPYGETNCKWDSVIDLEEFWKEFKRLRKSKKTACIHFCSTKFGYTLIKSNEKMFKMDMVWKKRNKTGGLQSRHRPMRNHEMVYFFYEQAPKYNRDTYHKRIQAKKEHNIEKECVYGNTSKMGKPGNNFNPPNPASVVEEKKYTKEHLDNNRGGAGTNNVAEIFSKENRNKYIKENGVGFEPPNPASVLEEKTTYGIDKSIAAKSGADISNMKCSFEPPNPASVIEEEKCLYGFNKKDKQNYAVKDLGKNHHFDPPNPASVVEENAESNKVWGYDKPDTFKIDKNGTNQTFKPALPASVVEEELIEPAEDEPKSMYESKKVFIGKRHHQTEKPLDILEFFIKYWSDEGQTILDPTMGSGSTGVACKTLKRNFIGYEMDEKIFKVAETRIDKVKII